MLLKGYLDNIRVGKLMGIVVKIFNKRFDMVSDVMNRFGIVCMWLFNVIIMRVVELLIIKRNKMSV